MTKTSADVRGRPLADPELLADYERLPSILDAREPLRDLLEGAVFVPDTGKRVAQLQRRAWRAKQRAANRPPLPAKVVHPRVLVELPTRVKKGKVTSR